MSTEVVVTTNSLKISMSASLEGRANATAFTHAILRAGDGGVEVSGTGVANSGGAMDSVSFGGWNEMLLNTQSINGLQQVSQLCPRTTEQLTSNGVTQNVMEWVSPEGKQIGKSTVEVITEFEVPSNSQSGIGGIANVRSLWTEVNMKSMKQ